MKNGKGILALLGLAAGAFAFWQYKKMPPEKKAELKDKISNAGRQLKDKINEGEASLTEKYEQLKDNAKTRANDYRS